MKKILITGASGFIGRNLKEQLTEYNLLTPSHNDLDLTKEDYVEEYFYNNKPDVIIHSAGKQTACSEAILRMFLNLLRYRPKDCKLIYFGSGAEYTANTEYGLAKKIINDMIRIVPNVFNLRLFGVFGKYEEENRRFLSVCCKAILEKQPIYVKENKRFDYLYVNDLVQIVKWFIESNPRRKDYDICTSSPLYLSDWADTLMSNIGEKTTLILERSINCCYSGNNQNFLDESNFKFTPIEQSLKELYEYYKTR